MSMVFSIAVLNISAITTKLIANTNNRPTDVLSFPMLSDDFDIELEEESLGDIVISVFSYSFQI